ncbi:hypothetical protein SteCoe_20289 [Stentor coeruleus]|uniref:Uncharacterized protein n=1 Tax=Stentor coeruleus TaxID=5963 RepID=A0A1R2BSM7_9CILI|nr:hypothetical protein SteCoe_20289 [Stentor coeruleus]
MSVSEHKFLPLSTRRHLNQVNIKRPYTAKYLNPSQKIQHLNQIQRKLSCSQFLEKPFEEKEPQLYIATARVYNSERPKKITNKPSAQNPQQSILKLGVHTYKLEKSRSVATIMIKSYNQPGQSSENIPRKAFCIDKNIKEDSKKIIIGMQKTGRYKNAKPSYHMKTQLLEFNNIPLSSTRRAQSKKSLFRGESNTVYPFTKLARLLTPSYIHNIDLCVTSARGLPFN